MKTLLISNRMVMADLVIVVLRGLWWV